MGLALVNCRALDGIDAPHVTVEVNLAGGLPQMSIVGLPETAVKESKDRVRAAIQNCNFEFPVSKITVNLAPADLPKEGSRFDLAIAMGILCASGQLPPDCLEKFEFVAELALGGGLRPVRGCLPASLAASRAGRALITAHENAPEAALVAGAAVYPAASLAAVCRFLKYGEGLSRQNGKPVLESERNSPLPCLSDVRGQQRAKRALECAAAGGHNLLFTGSPGTGKTMLASRLPGILPPMTEPEAIASATVLSISGGGFDPRNWRKRNFRSPHHTASGIALVGGGSNPRPGEISLAHHGVLFLDELPEFDRRVLEVLREPLESGKITISRATRQAEFPAEFQLIAAMNPCPCGYAGDETGVCNCPESKIVKYRGKISGPLLDRIDIQLQVPRIPTRVLHRRHDEVSETSETVRARVIAARERQVSRSGCQNARLTNPQIEEFCQLQPQDHDFIEQAIDRLKMTARSYHRILKLARTIADLAGVDRIDRAHLSEAIGYRRAF